MFKYELQAFEKAKSLVQCEHSRRRVVIHVGDEQFKYNNTRDADQAYRILVVNMALHILGRPLSKTAGMLSENVYSAFAYEVEKV